LPLVNITQVYITTVIVYQVHYFQDEELPDTKFSHVRSYILFLSPAKA